MAIAEWINLSRTSGVAGLTTVTVTASSNTELEERMTSITVSTRHTNLSETVVFTQPSYYYGIPLTIEVIEGSGRLGMLRLDGQDSSYWISSVKYSKNGGVWTDLNRDSVVNGIEVVQGDVICLKGTNATYSDGDCYFSFVCRDYQAMRYNLPKINIYGNVMSLVYGDNFIGQTTLTSAYTFYNLFQGLNETLVSAENLILPATTLTPYCYYYMFNSLVTVVEGEPPERQIFTTSPKLLPATTLADNCYNAMFAGCGSLTTVPTLPATTLANQCYQQMFQECYSLTTVPNNYLPATSLSRYCYNNMFIGCTSLTTAPALPATTLAPYCYNYMFGNCHSLTTVPTLPATTLANECYNGMYAGCKSLTNIPNNYLPATVLTQACYFTMFAGCTGLTSVPTLPATTLAQQCYYGMFEGCTSLATVPSNMLPATSLKTGCYENMFSGCTSLTTAPTLPAQQLTPFCYQNMFNGCSSLNYIKCLATTINLDSTKNWVQNVASSGIFVKNSSMTGWTTGNNGIPTNWTVYDDGSEPVYTTIPLTFKITGSGNLVFRANNTSAILTVEYKKNNGSWTELTTSTGETAPSIPVVSGDTVQFRGNNETYAVNVYGYNTFADSTCSFNVEGNIMSLINSTNFSTLTTLTSAHTFYYLFRYCTGLTDASNLVLPATALTYNCYGYMFYHCDNLTTAPELPATTLTTQCYYGMFSNCSSLTTAPTLPATTLADYCYNSMFSNCYRLNYIECLATDISATNCTNGWVNNVALSGTFVKAPSITGWSTGSSGIPSGWTVQDAS